MDINNVRQDILAKCKEIEDCIDWDVDSTKLSGAQSKLLETITRGYKKIQEKAKREKYSLYFMGPTAQGKTTAIASLLGFYDTKTYGRREEYKAFKLVTGTANTTPCDTVFVQTEGKAKSRILIEGLSEEEFYELCKDYALMKKEGVVNEDKPEIPRELERFVEAYCDIDPKEVGSKGYIQPDARVWYKKANYQSRTKTVFEIDSGSDFLDNLYNQLKAIVTPTQLDCPIPKRITLEINKKDIDFGLPSYIDKVVDNRGVHKLSDHVHSMGDIMKSEDALKMLCYGITDAGRYDELDKALKTHISDNKDLQELLHYLCLGSGDAYELDMNIKEDPLQYCKSRVKKRGITPHDNVFIHDSYIGFGDGYQLDSDKVKEHASAFWKYLEDSLQRNFKGWLEMLKSIGSVVEGYLTGNSSPNLDECFGKICNAAKQNYCEVISAYQPNTLPGEIAKEFSGHASSTVAASVRRGGLFENLNLYSDTAPYVVGSTFDEAIHGKFSELKGFIQSEVGRPEYELPYKNELTTILKEELDTKRNSERIALLEGLTVSLEDDFYVAGCWEKANEHWGKGFRDYRGKVRSTLQEGLDKSQIKFDDLIKDSIERVFSGFQKSIYPDPGLLSA